MKGGYSKSGVGVKELKREKLRSNLVISSLIFYDNKLEHMVEHLLIEVLKQLLVLFQQFYLTETN